MDSVENTFTEDEILVSSGETITKATIVTQLLIFYDVPQSLVTVLRPSLLYSSIYS